MTDLEAAIVEVVAANPQRRATPEELAAPLADRGVDAGTDEIARACDDLVQAGELQVVGERGDAKLYELVRDE